MSIESEIVRKAGSTRQEIQRFYSHSRSSSEKIVLEWKDIHFSTLTPDKVNSTFLKQVFLEKQILKGVGGSIQSGELLAILGPTGCGKTSLLNILAARVPSSASNLASLSGSITLNGKPRIDEFQRRISAYVLQDDNMYPHLTVKETLMLSAHFFLPNDTPLDAKVNIVETIIADLGLNKAADTRIGNEKVRGVSGGERKRAAIAVQLISDPAVLFLDEPTSGLDAFQAQSVMDSMKNLSQLGRLVISVIHQPRSSIFQMFDKLMLLSEGRTMYFGPADSAVEYFASFSHICPESFNPSDFFLDILSPDNRFVESEAESANRIRYLGDMWEQKSRSAATKSDLVKDQSSVAVQEEQQSIKTIGSEFKVEKIVRNFRLLCWRAFTEQSRDITTIRFKLVVTVLFSLLLGGIYNKLGYHQKGIQNRIGLLFFVCINTAFNSVSSVLNTFPREKIIVNRERSGRAYNTLSYFVAKFGMELPLTVFPSIVFSCILFWLAELNKETFGYFVLILMLVSLVAVSLGLAISAMVPTVEAASALGTPLIVIGILFGGFYISVDSLPIVANWIPYFSFLRWGFQALSINEFTGLKFDCVGVSDERGCIRTGEQVLQNLGFDHHTTAYPVFGLGMLLLGFLAVTYLAIDRNQASYLRLGHIGSKYAAHQGKSPITSTSLVRSSVKKDVTTEIDTLAPASSSSSAATADDIRAVEVTGTQSI